MYDHHRFEFPTRANVAKEHDLWESRQSIVFQQWGLEAATAYISLLTVCFTQ